MDEGLGFRVWGFRVVGFASSFCSPTFACHFNCRYTHIAKSLCLASRLTGD